MPHASPGPSGLEVEFACAWASRSVTGGRALAPQPPASGRALSDRRPEVAHACLDAVVAIGFKAADLSACAAAEEASRARWLLKVLLPVSEGPGAFLSGFVAGATGGRCKHWVVTQFLRSRDAEPAAVVRSRTVESVAPSARVQATASAGSSNYARAVATRAALTGRCPVSVLPPLPHGASLLPAPCFLPAGAPQLQVLIPTPVFHCLLPSPRLLAP